MKLSNVLLLLVMMLLLLLLLLFFTTNTATADATVFKVISEDSLLPSSAKCNH